MLLLSLHFFLLCSCLILSAILNPHGTSQNILILTFFSVNQFFLHDLFELEENNYVSHYSARSLTPEVWPLPEIKV